MNKEFRSNFIHIKSVEKLYNKINSEVDNRGKN